MPNSQLCKYPVPMCEEHFKQCTQDVPELVQDGPKIDHTAPERTASLGKYLYYPIKYYPNADAAGY